MQDSISQHKTIFKLGYQYWQDVQLPAANTIMSITNITSLTRKYIIIIGLVLAFAANAYFYISKDDASAKPASLTQAQTALINIGEKCVDFGERAVANDTPIIEFQMIVRLTKKTTVISNCMTDNGYKQNLAWVKYAGPIANAAAVKADISVSEALSNLSRSDMQVFEAIKNRPDYWVKQ